MLGCWRCQLNKCLMKAIVILRFSLCLNDSLSNHKNVFIMNVDMSIADQKPFEAQNRFGCIKFYWTWKMLSRDGMNHAFDGIETSASIKFNDDFCWENIRLSCLILSTSPLKADKIKLTLQLQKLAGYIRHLWIFFAIDILICWNNWNNCSIIHRWIEKKSHLKLFGWIDCFGNSFDEIEFQLHVKMLVEKLVSSESASGLADETARFVVKVHFILRMCISTL